METSQNKSPSEGTDFKELRLLEELEETPQITQRKMADRLGIALGVANLLTKNLTQFLGLEHSTQLVLNS